MGSLWRAGAGVAAAGAGALAYTLGMRHAFDADHIAAIDNSTRRFVGQGKRPASVGLAFSMGHSSVVILAGILVVLGATFVSSFISEGTAANTTLGVIGGTVSGVFLLVIGLYNAGACAHSWRLRRRAREGRVISEEDLLAQGLVSRVMAKPLARVQRPRNIFTLGFLFGLVLHLSDFQSGGDRAQIINGELPDLLFRPGDAVAHGAQDTLPRILADGNSPHRVLRQGGHGGE